MPRPGFPLHQGGYPRPSHGLAHRPAAAIVAGRVWQWWRGVRGHHSSGHARPARYRDNHGPANCRHCDGRHARGGRGWTLHKPAGQPRHIGFGLIHKGRRRYPRPGLQTGPPRKAGETACRVRWSIDTATHGRAATPTPVQARRATPPNSGRGGHRLNPTTQNQKSHAPPHRPPARHWRDGYGQETSTPRHPMTAHRAISG